MPKKSFGFRVVVCTTCGKRFPFQNIHKVSRASLRWDYGPKGPREMIECNGPWRRG